MPSPKRIEEGDTYTSKNITYKLKLVDSITLNELTIRVYQQGMTDLFTFEVYNVEEVTEVAHNLKPKTIIKTVFSALSEAYGS